ncbi:MAG: hydrolase [Alphaproteobacteria bacterium]|nr:MAG: hydrolase [Alphaproteobacteria bacterium]
MKYRLIMIVSLIGALVSGCDSAKNSASADTIYVDGDILTMEGDTPTYAEAVAVKDGEILFVGDRQTAFTYRTEATDVINLEGKTFMPGFIDSHGHIYGVGLQTISARLLSPPDGTVTTVADILTIMQAYIDDPVNQELITKTGWIIGFGYDDSLLDFYPTAKDLDKLDTDYPVMIIHTSLHLSVLNSKGLEVAGFTAETENPQGGIIRRKAGTNEPNGVLEEMPFIVTIFGIMNSFDENIQAAMIKGGQDLYASYGFTTAQEARASTAGLQALERASKDGKLVMDVVAYADFQRAKDSLSTSYYGQTYTNRYRIGGVKLGFDGSPQGKTAWLTHAYHVAPDGQPADYAGYGSYPDAKAFALIDEAFEKDWQVLVHANGDAAIDQMITGIALATEKYGPKDRRPVLIHGQTLRQDQIGKLAELDIFPSLFPIHTFYWGDWHEQSVLGQPRADFISPAKAVLEAGLKFTSHHDAPVVLPNAMRILSATVTRRTRSGKVLGPDQSVSTYIALKSITDWAAYQLFEEADKGTLAVGKKADFVILDQNPLKVDPDSLMEIKVLQTISAGKVIYEKP